MRIWEQAFDEPYERAGACLVPAGSPSRESFYWDCNTPPVSATAAESNRKYRALQPRSLMEVSLTVCPRSKHHGEILSLQILSFLLESKLVRNRGPDRILPR